MRRGILSRLSGAGLALGVVAGLLGARPALADTVVKVSAATPNHWTITDTTCTGGAPATGAATAFRAGPATPPSGGGSVQFDVGVNGDSTKSIRYDQLSGTPLSAITALGYWTNIQTPVSGNPTADTFLSIAVDFTGDTTPDDAIFFEPAYQHGYNAPVPDQGPVAAGTWQHWDALAGGWWSNSTPGVGPGADVKTIAQYLAIHPSARAMNSGASGALQVRAGCGASSWQSFVGDADALTIGVNGSNSLHDFELDAQLPASVITFPANNGNYTTAAWGSGCAAPGFCGTATDTGAAGVSKVTFSLFSVAAGSYWDGAGFASAAPVFLDAAGTSSWSVPFPAARFGGDGAYVLNTRAVDAATNVETPGPTSSFDLDSTAPSLGVTFPADGALYGAAAWGAGCAPAGVCGSAFDSGSGIQRVDVSVRRSSTGLYWNGTAFAAAAETFVAATGLGSWKLPLAFAALPTPDSYAFRARATDAAGNTLASPLATFTVDGSAPLTTVAFPAHGRAYGPTIWNGSCASGAGFCGTSNDSGTSGIVSISYSLKRNSDARFWDGTSFASATEVANAFAPAKDWFVPFAASKFADGSYTLRVRATDALGNTEPGTPVVFSLLSTPPAAPAIDAPARGAIVPARSTASGRAPGSATADVFDNNHWIGRVAVSGAGAWTMPLSLNGGAHTLSVTAYDAAGNVSAASPSVSFTVDAAPPVASISTPSLTIFLPTDSPAIAGTSSDNIGVASVRLTYTDAIRGTLARFVVLPCGECGSSARTVHWSDAPGLGLGVYNVQAEAIDEVGNSSKSSTITFVVL
jgi:hypothetical protein